MTKGEEGLMADALIALGGNVGNVVETMDAALDALDSLSTVSVGQVSRVYETTPVGSRAGEAYLNAAAELETSLPAGSLLAELQQIEQSLGRTAGQRWTNRPIDLDLLLMEDRIVDTRRLTLPHPHLWYRRFVLDPLVEIAPDAVHPVWEVTIRRLRDNLLRRPLQIAIAGGCAEDRLAVGSIVRRAGMRVVARPSTDEGPLRIVLVDEAGDIPDDEYAVSLSTLPGSLTEAAASIVTAMIDEPQPHSRPLRRMP
jgi:2-amino-4-hydroxy-6-hydroxymethyldihydropteridine diphosphokinase